MTGVEGVLRRLGDFVSIRNGSGFELSHGRV